MRSALLLGAILLGACPSSPPAAPPPAPAPTSPFPSPTPPPAPPPPAPPTPPTPAPPVPAPAPGRTCGLSPSDWCPSPPEDPCGAHRDAASCRADPNCEGMPYRGESVVACMLDDRCFASNCPAVGCVSRCETLDAACATVGAGRCQLDRDARCVRARPCR